MRRLALRRKCHACKKVLDNGNGGPGHKMRKVCCTLCRRNFCLDCVEFLPGDEKTAKKVRGIGLFCKVCRAELALTSEVGLSTASPPVQNFAVSS